MIPFPLGRLISWYFYDVSMRVINVLIDFYELLGYGVMFLWLKLVEWFGWSLIYVKEFKVLIYLCYKDWKVSYDKDWSSPFDFPWVSWFLHSICLTKCLLLFFLTTYMLSRMHLDSLFKLIILFGEFLQNACWLMKNYAILLIPLLGSYNLCVIHWHCTLCRFSHGMSTFSSALFTSVFSKSFLLGFFHKFWETF